MGLMKKGALLQGLGIARVKGSRIRARWRNSSVRGWWSEGDRKQRQAGPGCEGL